MKQRTSSIPLMAVVAVIALVLGSIGTAVAAPALTKGKVKKIAAKVVAQKAPTLSVASAGNANNLGGKGPGSYLNAATVFNSVTAVGATSHTITIPLAPGNYTVGYSVLMVGGSGYSFCQVTRTRPASPTLVVADDTSQATGTPSASGYGAVDVLAGDTVRLACNSATAWTISASQAAQIVVQPVDSTVATVTPLPAAKGTAGRAG
jgi:hypothetical protein